jgi:hypothetical protein
MKPIADRRLSNEEAGADLNTSVPWSPTAVVDLLTAMAQGQSVDAIAETLCRTPLEVRQRIEQERQAARKEALDSDRWRNAKPCLVRYGEPPPDGRSCNATTGELEGGVSVFHGEVLPTGAARAVPHTLSQLVTALRHERDHSPLYLVTGDQTGIGSDGEPLLKNCRWLQRAERHPPRRSIALPFQLIGLLISD